MELVEGSRFQWKHPRIIDSESKAYSYTVLFVISMLLILSIFAVMSTAVANEVIRGQFSLSISKDSWINTSLLLALVIAVPLSEYLADKHGFKWILFLGTLLFSLGTFLSGISNGFLMLLFSRIITGIGTGIYVPISLGILANAFPSRLLPFALAIYSAVGFGGGLSFAFLFGGYLAQYASWHWVFFPSVIVGVMCLAVIWLILQETEPKEVSKFDSLGYGLYCIAMCSFLTMLVSAKAPWNTEGWYSPFMKTLYLLLACSIVLFFIVELRSVAPLFHIRLFKIRAFVLGNVLLAIVGAIYFGTAQTMPAILQDLLHYSKFKSGLYMIPHGICLGLSSAALGILLSRIGIRVPLVIGCFILGFSCFFQMDLSVYSDHKYIISLLVLRGLGVGLTMGPVTALALRRVDKKYVANATMIVTLFRQTGAASANSLLDIVKVQRGTLHQTRFLEQLGEKTTEFVATFHRLQIHFASSLGEGVIVAKEQAKGRIFRLVHEQALLAGLNDGYFILGIATTVVTLVVIFFMLYAKFKGKIVDVHHVTQKDIAGEKES